MNWPNAVLSGAVVFAAFGLFLGLAGGTADDAPFILALLTLLILAVGALVGLNT